MDRAGASASCCSTNNWAPPMPTCCSLRREERRSIRMIRRIASSVPVNRASFRLGGISLGVGRRRTCLRTHQLAQAVAIREATGRDDRHCPNSSGTAQWHGNPSPVSFASRSVRVSDRLLDLFLRSTEDYAIILFDPDGRVQRWSRGAEKLFGFSAEELEGTLAHEIFVPPDRQAGVPEVELQVATEQGRAEDERWHLRKDGSRFWASGVMISLKE